MEAKGCAKPMVWKNARRHFYWALRARLAKSAALDAIEEASPDSTLEYREELVDKLASIDARADDQTAAAALEALDLTGPLSRLRGDHISSQLVDLFQSDRKGAIGGLVNFIDTLSEEDKMAIRTALQTSTR
jgi:acetyl-CoA carboxylase/biotin carboxylase 1